MDCRDIRCSYRFLGITLSVVIAKPMGIYKVHLPIANRNDSPVYSRYLTYIHHENIVVSRADVVPGESRLLMKAAIITIPF